MGVPTSKNTYGGENCGAFISTSSINPANWTRSYSRTGYLDPIPPRQNFDVLTNAHVTRLLFNSSSPKDNLAANAVEYTTDGGTTKLRVNVKKEVILASGTVGSPAVLLHSGVGPKKVLSAAGVQLVHDLPGVGQHLQDHLLATVYFNTTQPTAGSIWADEDPLRNDTSFLSFINSAVAYINSTRIYGDSVKDVQESLLKNIDKSAPTGDIDKSVMAGYEAIYKTTANTIFDSPMGQIELLLVSSALDGSLGITAALQHPFSHGQITIGSLNPLDDPVIDPGYLAHPNGSSLSVCPSAGVANLS